MESVADHDDRWLINQGRDEEALAVLSSVRNLAPDSDVVQIEYLYVHTQFTIYRATNGCFSEIRAQYLFEKEVSATKFPQFQDGSFASSFKLGVYDYMSLLTTRSTSSLLLARSRHAHMDL